MPNSKKAAGERRAFGFGLSKRLKGANKTFGIAPAEEGVGEACGGEAVGGKGAEGLKAEKMRRPRAYASATEG